VIVFADYQEIDDGLFWRFGCKAYFVDGLSDVMPSSPKREDLHVKSPQEVLTVFVASLAGELTPTRSKGLTQEDLQ